MVKQILAVSESPNCPHETAISVAAMSNRFSVYSASSATAGPRSAAQQATQLSTTTLLNALHTSYASGQPYQLDAGTSLVVNTWFNAASPGTGGQFGGTIDPELAKKAWEHARRRAEDGCVVLWSGCLHRSSTKDVN